MRCDIVIPVWNKKEMTRQCINSISANTHCDYSIIIIDNASNQPTRAYLDEVKTQYPDRIIIIRNQENVGNTRAVNQGILSSMADYVCILDNDTLVFDDWLSEMIRVAESSKDIGIIGPNSNSGKKKPWNKSYQQYAEEITAGKQGQYTETAAVIGFCYLVKKDVIDKIGMWDERFSPGYFEDTEYCIRAREAGYKCVFAKGAFVYHFEHASFKSREFNILFKQSEEKFYSLYKRPQRVLYILTNPSNRHYNQIKQESYNLAKNSNWVSIFLKKSAPKIDLHNHAYIKVFRFSDIFINFITIVKVLLKKKKFSKIIVDNKNLSTIMILLKRYHKAEVQLLSSYET
jgi:GT2 family glycosyltransferase